MSSFFQKALSLFGDRAESEIPQSNAMPPDIFQPNLSPPDLSTSTSPEQGSQPVATVVIPNLVKYQWVYNLTVANCQEFEALTFPSLKKRWQTYQQRGDLGGVAAIVNGQMVGLLVVELLSDRAEILSLFVVPEHRRQGIGFQLVRYVELGLKRINCPQMQVRYQVSELTNSALETILHRQGWQTPKTDFLITKATIEAFKQAPWVYQYPLPTKFTVFPWIELSEAERDQILQRQTYPANLSPFDPDPRLEPINSLGLRYQGEVIGWTINHRIAPDTIRYSTMFVEARFQRLGRGFSLLTEAIKRQIDSGIPYATAAVSSDNLPMLHCADRYYKPFATYLSESRSSYKVLG